MPEIEKKWYVLRTVSGQEAKVKEYLDAELKVSGLNEYVSQVLVPTEKFVQMRNNKRVVSERNILPGYVLVEAALVGEVAHHLRFSPNVLGFLGGLDNPTPLRPKEVERILTSIDMMREVEIDAEAQFEVDDRVKVVDGPFNGFLGVVEEVNRERRKLKVMVKFFGRKTPVELSFTQVEKE